MAAQPEIEKRVETMVSNHRWMPPGYKVRDIQTLGLEVANANNHYRRSLVTSLLSRCGGCSSIVSCIVENKCILFRLGCGRR